MDLRLLTPQRFACLSMNTLIESACSDFCQLISGAQPSSLLRCYLTPGGF